MQYTITGKVIDKRNSGIENLVVVFYDTDRENKFDKAKNIFEALNKAGAERLGSVYTNQAGAFIFHYDYTDFAPDNEEERPDLLFVILKPAGKDIDENSRVLYKSNVSVKNVGKTEAIIIKLGDEDELEIEQKTTSVAVDTAFKRIENESNKRQPYLNLVAKNIKKKLVTAQQEDPVLNILNGALFTSPKTITNGPFFLKDQKNLKALQKTAVDKGMEKLTKGANNPKVMMAVHYSKEDFDRAGIEDVSMENGGEVEITYNKYCALTNKRGKTLIRKSKLWEIFEEKLNPKPIIPDKKDEESNSGTPSLPSAPEPIDSTSFIKNGLSNMVQPPINRTKF